MPESIVKANCWPVAELSENRVTLPNGNRLTTNRASKLRVCYDPAELTEIVKFYVLPINGTLILGGDWLIGNKI